MRNLHAAADTLVGRSAVSHIFQPVYDRRAQGQILDLCRKHTPEKSTASGRAWTNLSSVVDLGIHKSRDYIGLDLGDMYNDMLALICYSYKALMENIGQRRKSLVLQSKIPAWIQTFFGRRDLNAVGQAAFLGALMSMCVNSKSTLAWRTCPY